MEAGGSMLMALISWKRLLLAAWDFCNAFLEPFDHVLPLKSVKKLDSVPSDQSNFASSTDGSVPSGGETSHRLPGGVRGGDSKKGSRLRHLPLQVLEALQMKRTVIIITITTALAGVAR